MNQRRDPSFFNRNRRRMSPKKIFPRRRIRRLKSTDVRPRTAEENRRTGEIPRD
jgi:hypothetical protein